MRRRITWHVMRKKGGPLGLAQLSDKVGRTMRIHSHIKKSWEKGQVTLKYIIERRGLPLGNTADIRSAFRIREGGVFFGEGEE